MLLRRTLFSTTRVATCVTSGQSWRALCSRGTALGDSGGDSGLEIRSSDGVTHVAFAPRCRLMERAVFGLAITSTFPLFELATGKGNPALAVAYLCGAFAVSVFTPPSKSMVRDELRLDAFELRRVSRSGVGSIFPNFLLSYEEHLLGVGIIVVGPMRHLVGVKIGRNEDSVTLHPPHQDGININLVVEKPPFEEDARGVTVMQTCARDFKANKNLSIDLSATCAHHRNLYFGCLHHCKNSAVTYCHQRTACAEGAALPPLSPSTSCLSS